MVKTKTCLYHGALNMTKLIMPGIYQLTFVHQALNGYFSVQCSDNNRFGRIPVYQTIEVAVNKDTQTTGGTAKFILKPPAVKEVLCHSRTP